MGGTGPPPGTGVLIGVGVGLFTPEGCVGVGVGFCTGVEVGGGVLVGFGVGEGVGEGVGVGFFVGEGVGVQPFLGEGVHLRGITDDAASAGIILSTTQNRPVRSMQKATNIINIIVLLLRLLILFDITNSFITIKIHIHRSHPNICVFLTINTSAAPALRMINRNR